MGSERIQLDHGRAPGQRLRHPAYQCRLRRAQDDEPAQSGALCVNGSAQGTEDRGHGLGFVENQSCVGAGVELEPCVLSEPLGSSRVLQIEIAVRVERRPCQSRLADLSRAEYDDDRETGRGGMQRGDDRARKHPCILEASIPICKSTQFTQVELPLGPCVTFQCLPLPPRFDPNIPSVPDASRR